MNLNIRRLENTISEWNGRNKVFQKQSKSRSRTTASKLIIRIVEANEPLSDKDVKTHIEIIKPNNVKKFRLFYKVFDVVQAQDDSKFYLATERVKHGNLE
ncbi:7147_t:CDS:2 [Funneliformis geosporum]|uniref:7821_t:CDS:1 n=1 Tax=Funneliformis geosporum TaxID=1117311 RepID=A0A9W4WX21_9GLOM|nr:7147_t:CDS:2 [Funneliformis geosporum]CAI2185445.1 7821_t:CDS:2 [Funneliformis geosporum]